MHTYAGYPMHAYACYPMHAYACYPMHAYACYHMHTYACYPMEWITVTHMNQISAHWLYTKHCVWCKILLFYIGKNYTYSIFLKERRKEQIEYIGLYINSRASL